MIRVFLADDHEIVLDGLRRLLASAPDLRIVGEATDGRATLAALETLEAVDVLVLDLSLPRVSGVEVLRRVRERWPLISVLVLSMYPAEQYQRRLMGMGAAGYLSKSRPSQEVLSAIRELAREGRTAGAPLTRENTTTGEQRPHDALSPREYQVFMLLLQSRSASEVAAELDLSASTVSNHVTAIRNKLGARTVGDIVAYAAREGLIGAPVSATTPGDD
jgi:DNA-binding NarL/FixJ family response regulator